MVCSMAVSGLQLFMPSIIAIIGRRFYALCGCIVWHSQGKLEGRISPCSLAAGGGTRMIGCVESWHTNLLETDCQL